MLVLVFAAYPVFAQDTATTGDASAQLNQAADTSPDAAAAPAPSDAQATKTSKFLPEAISTKIIDHSAVGHYDVDVHAYLCKYCCIIM